MTVRRAATVLVAALLLAATVRGADRGDVDLAWLAGRTHNYGARAQLILAGPPAVPHLLEHAAGADEAAALRAAGTVRWIVVRWRDDPAAHSALVDQLSAFALAEEVPAARRAFAVDLLGDLGLAAVPSLERLLTVSGLSDTAVLALGRIPNEAPRQALVDALDRPAPNRALVLETLGARGESASVAVLVAAAERGEAAALEALADAATPEARDWLLAAAEEGSAAAFEALLDEPGPRLSGERLARLLEIARDDDARRRVLAAVRSPAQYDAALAAVLLAGGMAADLERARLQALVTLAPALEPQDAARVAADALALAPDPVLTPRALWLCAERCPPVAAARLGELVRADDPAIGLAAARALGRMEGEAASAEILSALEAAPRAVAAEVLVEALGGRTDRVAISGLLERLAARPAERPEAVVEAALATASTADEEAARQLWTATLAVEPTTEALAGLGRTGGADEIALLEPLLGADDEALRTATLEALVAIGRRLAAGTPEPDRRRAAITALESAFGAGAAVEGELRGLGERLELVAQRGSIDAWWHTGLSTRRCATASPPAERMAALDQAPVDTAVWQPLQAPDPSSSLALPTGGAGTVEWLAADLAPRTAERAVVVVRASSPVELWLDGRRLEPNASTPREGDPEQRFAASLSAGANRLVVRLCRGGQPLRLGVRLEDAEGRALKFRMW